MLEVPGSSVALLTAPLIVLQGEDETVQGFASLPVGATKNVVADAALAPAAQRRIASVTPRTMRRARCILCPLVVVGRSRPAGGKSLARGGRVSTAVDALLRLRVWRSSRRPRCCSWPRRSG